MDKESYWISVVQTFQTSPYQFWLNLEDFDRHSMVAVFRKVEDVAVLEDLLDEWHLSLGVLPAPVEHVDREGGLEALDLEAQLEGLDEQDQALTVPHDEAGVVQLVDDLLPVEVGVQLMQHLDENLRKISEIVVGDEKFNLWVRM